MAAEGVEASEVERVFAEQSSRLVFSLAGSDKLKRERVLAITRLRDARGKPVGWLSELRRDHEGCLALAGAWRLHHLRLIEAPRSSSSDSRETRLVVHTSKPSSALDLQPSSLRQCSAFVGSLVLIVERVTQQRIGVPSWSDDEVDSAVDSVAHLLTDEHDSSNTADGTSTHIHDVPPSPDGSGSSQRQSSGDSTAVGQKEGERIEALLAKHQLDVADAELFENRLQREVAALETASVEAILHGKDGTDKLIESIESTEQHANDLEEALGIYIDVLSCIKDGADAIDAHSNESRVSQTNAQSLRDTLSSLFALLQLNDGVQEALMHQPLDDIPNLERITSSARTLNERLQAITADENSSWASQLRAVREKQEELKSLKNRFTSRALNFLQKEIDDACLRPEGNSERLEQMMPIAEAVQELDTSAIDVLREMYCRSFNAKARRQTKRMLSPVRSGNNDGQGSEERESYENQGSNQRVSGDVMFNAISEAVSNAGNFASMLEPLRLVGGNKERDAGPVLPEAELAEAIDGIVNMISQEIDCASWFLQLPPNSELENESLGTILEGVGDEILTVCDWLSKRSGPGASLKLLGILSSASRDIQSGLKSTSTNASGSASSKGGHRHFSRIADVLRASEERLSQAVRTAVTDKLNALSRVDNARSGRYGAVQEVVKLAFVLEELEQSVQSDLATPETKHDAVGDMSEVHSNGKVLRRSHELQPRETARTELAGELYAKVMAQLPDDINRMAEYDEKHKHQITFVNLRGFCTSCSSLKGRGGQHASTLRELEREMESAKSRYVDEMLARPFESLHFVLTSLRSKRRSGVPLSELQYQAEVSLQDVRRKIQRSLAPRKAEQGVKELSKRLHKHLSFDPELLSETWQLCIDRLLSWHEETDTMLREGYNEVLVPSRSEIEKICSSYATH
jgi:hypothetical protein